MYKATQNHQSEVVTFGSDSLALDIQRSRDHGLPGYTKYVKLCSGLEIQSWDDLNGLVHDEDLEVFKKTYKTHEDIDLIVGALAEIPRHDATVGLTLSCIIGTLNSLCLFLLYIFFFSLHLKFLTLKKLTADQLYNSRINDPNFYALHANEVDRNVSQIAARLLCEITKMSHVQNNIFLVPSTLTGLVF